MSAIAASLSESDNMNSLAPSSLVRLGDTFQKKIGQLNFTRFDCLFDKQGHTRREFTIGVVVDKLHEVVQGPYFAFLQIGEVGFKILLET
jgi:hypothetical protein